MYNISGVLLNILGEFVVTKNRRSRGTSRADHPLVWNNAEAIKKHQEFVEKIMERMIPLGKKATMCLVPIGHDISKNQRVSLDLRENPALGITEIFLTKDKLERVTVFQSSTVDERKYYLVLDEGASHTRIVWARYCVSLNSEELVLALLPKKRSVSKVVSV